MTAAVSMAAVLLLSGVSDGAAQAIRPADGGHVSVAAEAESLERLLAEFSGIASIRLWLQPGLGERLVTVMSEPVPAVEALRRVLRAAEVDFVIAGGVGDRPIRLVVGDSLAPDAADVLREPTGDAVFDAATAMVEPEDDGSGDDIDGAAVGPNGADLGPVISSPLPPAERLIQLLAPTGRPKPQPGEWFTLPFLDANGQPYTVQNIPPPAGTARLPFPDANGQPLEITVQPPPPGVFTLPFPGPDGRLYTVPSAPVPVPGRPPGNHD